MAKTTIKTMFGVAIGHVTGARSIACIVLHSVDKVCYRKEDQLVKFERILCMDSISTSVIISWSNKME